MKKYFVMIVVDDNKDIIWIIDAENINKARKIVDKEVENQNIERRCTHIIEATDYLFYDKNGREVRKMDSE